MSDTESVKIYPHQSGDFTVIGPECFTDGEVIAYKGENYVKQPAKMIPAEANSHSIRALALAIGLTTYSILLIAGVLIGVATQREWIIWVAITCGPLIAAGFSMAAYRFLTVAFNDPR